MNGQLVSGTVRYGTVRYQVRYVVTVFRGLGLATLTWPSNNLPANLGRYKSYRLRAINAYGKHEGHADPQYLVSLLMAYKEGRQSSTVNSARQCRHPSTPVIVNRRSGEARVRKLRIAY